MSERATWIVELGLGGSYREAVLADSPVGYWPMDEFRGTVATDYSTNAHNGTYVNTPTLGLVGPCPEGGSAVSFGSTESMDVADDADHQPASLSLEIWVRQNGNPNSAIAIKANDTATNGFGFYFDGSADAAFFVGSTATQVTASVSDGSQYRWIHLVGTYDGTNLRLYKNGVLVDGPTAGPGAIVHSSTALRVGTHASQANALVEILAHVALYDTVLDAATCLAHYTAGAWTDVTADVNAAAGMTIQRGVQGGTPNDWMASTGTATFALSNHVGNSAGLQGYYSPNHLNCRSGFTFGVPVRIFGVYQTVEIPVFRGRIHGIAPDTGLHRTRLTHCTAHDAVRDLATHQVRQVALQVDQTEDVLMYEILESLPFSARPPAVSLDTGLDTYPYAFDDLGTGRHAQSILKDVAVSSQGLVVVTSEGAFAYFNRQSLALLSSAATVNDTMLTDLVVPSDLEGAFNRIRITTHPKTVDAAATTVLFSHEGVPAVAAVGGTLELWGEYRNPSNTDQLIGGTAMVTPVSGTDFIANTAEDGSGSVITSDVTVAATFFASAVKLLLTNNHATNTAYFTTLQVRGKGIYDLSPITVEASSEQPYGERVLELDLKYQDNPNTAQGLAESIEMQYSQLIGQVERFSINPQRSATDMTYGLILGAHIGYPIAITETMSGLSSATGSIRSVDLAIGQGGLFTATFGVAPRTSFSVFVLNTSELDDAEDVLSYV